MTDGSYAYRGIDFVIQASRSSTRQLRFLFITHYQHIEQEPSLH
jgi:hypothetical protein